MSNGIDDIELTAAATGIHYNEIEPIHSAQMQNKPLAVETSHHSSSSVTVSIFGALSEILSHTTESLSFLTSTTTESSPLAHTHSTFLSTDPSHSKISISSTIQSAPKKPSSIDTRTIIPNTFDPFSSIDFASSESNEANEATVPKKTAAAATTSSPSNHRPKDDGEQVQAFISETSTKPSTGQLHLSSTNNDTLIDSSQSNGRPNQINETRRTNYIREESARLLKQTVPIESTISQNPIQIIPSSTSDPTTIISFVETTTTTNPLTTIPTPIFETKTELTTTPIPMNSSSESVSQTPNRTIGDTVDITQSEFRDGNVSPTVLPGIQSIEIETTNTSNLGLTAIPPLNAPILITQTTTTLSETSIPTTVLTTLLETTADIKLKSTTTEMPKSSTSATSTVKADTTATMTTVSAKIISTLNPTIPKNVELTTTQPPSVNIFDLMSKRVTALAESFAATESMRPIYMRTDSVPTTQSRTEATELPSSSHTPRFLTRIPILPIGFYGSSTRTTLQPPPLHSSMTTQKMQSSTSAPAPTKSPSTPKKPRRFDFVVYGILPNKTVIRKYPDDLFGSNDDSTTEHPAIIYGILSNRTVIRKFPNGTTQIDEAKSRSRAFEVTDIDVKSLFNPNSDIYVKQWPAENGVAATSKHSLATVHGERDGSATRNHRVIVNTSTSSTMSPAPSDINNHIGTNNSRDLLLQATVKTNNNSTNSTTTNTITINLASTNTTTTPTNTTTSLPSTYHNVNNTSGSAMVFNLPHTTIYSICRLGGWA